MLRIQTEIRKDDGRYAFTLPETLARGKLRPLRGAASASDEADDPALT